MDVAMMQPSFMSWQGLFELIYRSERFIFLDNFQFSVQSYHQRNRLFVNKEQIGWYSVPVQKSVSFKAPLNQTKINEMIPWRSKMLKRIRQNYAKAPYFPEIFPHVEKWLLKRAESLAEQNMDLIRLVCALMCFKREFIMSSQYHTQAKSSEHVLELLHWSGAKRYFCARGSFDYMRQEGVFPIDTIEVLFQDFVPRPYSQIGSPGTFIQSLSILDALMNIGAVTTAELIKNGTRKWLTWQDMAVIGG